MAPKRRESTSNATVLAAVESIGTSVNAGLHMAEIAREQISQELVDHSRLDTERFNKVEETLKEIKEDVKSLLASRSFSQGVIKTAMLVGGAVSFVISLIIGFWHKIQAQVH